MTRKPSATRTKYGRSGSSALPINGRAALPRSPIFRAARRASLKAWQLRRSQFMIRISCAWLVLVAFGISAADHAKVQSLAPAEALWTSGFWADRVELCRTQTVPALWRIMDGTNFSHFLQNFRIAIGEAEGRYRGAPFNDGEVYKLLEASIALLALTKDPALHQRVESAIELIARTQRPDGYIHTPVLVRVRNGDTNAVPFQDRHNFEMYNMGHLMTTASLHHRVTGKTNFLTIARRAADFLQRTFEGASPEAARSSVCPSHYMGIIDLYRTTGEPRYRELAKRFFELRSQITDGGDDNQDRIPFEQQTNAVGHAVRANYLYAGAADLFMATGETNVWYPLEPIWQNLVQRKMYITGGCGALFDGASPYGSKEQKAITRTHQAFGHDYELPNTTAHNETCANIGNVLWNWRMFLATGEARFIDVLELALYNSVLSGVALDGTNFFYVNPLRSTDPLPVELRWKQERVPFLSSFCCPPNLARTVAQSAQFAFAKSSDAVWVNLYGSSSLKTELSGEKIQLVLETEYPWSGRVRIVVKECGAREWAIRLRIPDYTRSSMVRVRVNQRIEAGGWTALPGTYCHLRRVWKPGDVIDLELPMPVQMLEANPLVEETLGQVALKRGPVVYCLESTDLPNGISLSQVRVAPQTEFLARHDQRLLAGVVVVEGQAIAVTNRSWAEELYRELRPVQKTPIRVRLIPYSVWANRGRSEMSVWLQTD